LQNQVIHKTFTKSWKNNCKSVYLNLLWYFFFWVGFWNPILWRSQTLDNTKTWILKPNSVRIPKSRWHNNFGIKSIWVNNNRFIRELCIKARTLRNTFPPKIQNTFVIAQHGEKWSLCFAHEKYQRKKWNSVLISEGKVKLNFIGRDNF
jgi:hypothetical protein